MSSSILSGELCRLIHDLQGHTFYTANTEATIQNAASSINDNAVQPSVKSKSWWSHIDCCGPHSIHYLITFYNTTTGRPELILWQKKRPIEITKLILGWSEEQALDNLEVSMQTLASEGVVRCCNANIFGRKLIFPLYIGAGGFGNYINEGIDKKLNRPHLRPYHKWNTAMTHVKTCVVTIHASMLHYLPPCDLFDENYSFFHWLNISQKEYAKQKLVSEAKKWSYPTTNIAPVYNKKELMEIDLESNMYIYHNTVTCDVCKELTPLFHNSEEGAVHLLKSMGMGE